MKGVKALRLHYKKALMVIQILVWILAPCSIFSADIVEVSAVPVSPYIAIVPEQTINSTITVGMDYTVSIYTDYTGTDIWAWQFDLTFNPDVLHGGVNKTDTWTGSGSRKTWYATKRPVIEGSEKVYVNQTFMTKDVNYTIEYPTGKITFMVAPAAGVPIQATYVGNGVVNGDLITTVKNPSANVLFFHGEFNNTAGRLSQTGASYEITPGSPRPATYGPGTLAYVSFMVVGTGYSNITFGSTTQLLEGGETEPPGKIIDAVTMPDQIGHGYFNNIPPIHDVAVIDLSAPATAIFGDLVPISVRVANEGNFTENFNVTVYANTTIIGAETGVVLASGEAKSLVFNWDTSTTLKGNYTYTINATAWPLDDKPGNNFRPASIDIRTAHDAAVTGLETPAQGIAGNIISINVTVANEGSFEENVTLTVTYQVLYSPTPPTLFNSTEFKLVELRTPQTLSVPWNTMSLAPDTYRINATATIDKIDEDSTDNSKTEVMSLNPAEVHDVAVVKVSANSNVVQGEIATVNVTVKNKGTFIETFDVTVSYDSTPIGVQTASLLAIGMNTTLNFEWNTTDVVPGIYAVIADAVLVGDAQTGDNQGVAAIVIETPPPPPPGHIAGTVRDASTENPIEGANVTTNGYFDVTDANGHFNITNVPPATYRVTASADGYQVSSRININVASGLTTNLDFNLTSLPTTGHITGTVKDASTENPIERANVTANDHSVLTGADGSYSIELQPGTYIVTVSAEGYADSSESYIIVKAGESTTVNFELALVQSPSILPYIGLAVIATIVVLGVAFYLYRIRGRKKTV